MARHGQKLLMRVAQNLLPKSFHYRMGWESYHLADACVAGTPWEKRLMTEMFAASPEKVHCVPNGVENIFFESSVVARGPWLVCAATITERKRVLEVAEAAVRAETPLWVVGQPYSADDSYGARFVEFARRNPRLVRYEGAIRDRKMLAAVYREARGFVLLSTMESLSLASMEAAACGCPLLLSDLPWARTTFYESATYCPVTSPRGRTVRVLREFYDAAPQRPAPPKPLSWSEVAVKCVRIYEGLSSPGKMG
jgi:glycosyltransferase involved in cell wall biosynthesis